MNETQIFHHFLSIEIKRRGLPYRTAVDQTAKAFAATDEKIAEIVLEHALDLDLSAQELEWLNFPADVIEVAAGAKKPNWTPLELNEKYLRWVKLGSETSNHDDCDCRSCMEHFGLTHQLACFTEDEMAGAVIEFNKLEETK